MEKNIFDATLEKACLSMEAMTGIALSADEGRIFIELFDMAESYLSAGQIRECKLPADANPLPRSIISTEVWPSATNVTPNPIFKAIDEPVAELVNEPNPVEKFKDIEKAYQLRDLALAEEHDKIETQRRTAVKKQSTFIETTDRRYHEEGYKFQLAALRRTVAALTKIHLFQEEPTPEQFVELYKLFDQHTHYVFLNKWDNNKQEWVNCTDSYMLVNMQAVKNLRSAVSPAWKKPEEKKLNHDAIYETGWAKTNCGWRVVRSDWKPEEYKYLTQEPTRVQLMKYTSPGHTAEKQQRPEYYR